MIRLIGAETHRWVARRGLWVALLGLLAILATMCWSIVVPNWPSYCSRSDVSDGVMRSSPAAKSAAATGCQTKGSSTEVSAVPTAADEITEVASGSLRTTRVSRVPMKGAVSSASAGVPGVT